MRKQLIIITTVALIGCANVAVAADLAADMETLADSYGKVLKSDDRVSFTAGLANMKVAAEDSKKSIPPKLEGKAANSPEMQGYYQGLDTLIAQIDKAADLANAGKMDEAKAEAKAFKEIRNENHKKFR